MYICRPKTTRILRACAYFERVVWLLLFVFQTNPFSFYFNIFPFISTSRAEGKSFQSPTIKKKAISAYLTSSLVGIGFLGLRQVKLEYTTAKKNLPVENSFLGIYITLRTLLKWIDLIEIGL